MVAEESRIWAITSYFNPVNYKRRRENFLIFRKHLQVPLIVVELSLNGKFDLCPKDSDIYLRVVGSSIMWQKERLLNIALENLPDSVEFVAWLDCDVVLPDRTWPCRTIEKLQESSLVQLFSTLHDLSPGERNPHTCKKPQLSGRGIAYLSHAEECPLEAFRPNNTVDMRRAAFGLAWAANVQLMKRHRFYDAMVIGSGDRALACAAFKKYEDAINAIYLDSVRIRHYMEWAERFSSDIKRVGYIEGSILHLWHGELADRGYAERHRAFSTLNFNPYSDICADPGAPLEWARNANAYNDFARRYFLSRNEDGGFQ